ncbi:MAG TPA: DUF3300 domain-containing protein, partial [Crenalkalicoccus sp.]|nr:DUF3300 domain-containing protein [Crenalkalicoccus sp.]
MQAGRSTTTPGWHRALATCVAASFLGTTVLDLPGRDALAQAVAATAPAAPAPQADAEAAKLSQAELEQLLAPVALYPDELLAQMLMAATYPLELVQAERWLQREGNANLKGEALAKALEAQPWDASVKSLVPFPEVLRMMNEQLEWTQRLGDAVLAQQQDVLNAVQVLRGRAQAAGKLESGPQQQVVTVTRDVNMPAAPAGGGPAGGGVVAPPPEIITIAPAQPDTVYVPAYNPSVVYGSWPYPSNPPAYYPPPAGWGLGSALLTGMAFAGGVALVGSLSGWASPGWNSGDVNINSSRVRNINRSVGDVGNRWQHNAAHRQGVAYSNEAVRNRYQGDRPDRSASREEFRGRAQQADRSGSLAGGERGALGDRGGAGER